MLPSREAGTAGGVGPPAPPSLEQREGETPPGRAGSRLGGLVDWRQRPCRTSALFAAANAVLWLAWCCSLRAVGLVAVLLAVLVVMVTVRDVARSRFTGAHSWRSMTASWEIVDSARDSRSGTGPQLGDSLKLFLQETSAFKQQNPGKFCLLVCSLCSFLAVVGRYVPGIVISYVLVLGVFLWPLISSHEVGSWLEPVLQKLDFGLGDFLQKIKANHEKRLVQAQTETGIESDLSSMFPKLDSTVCKEMSVSDTEVSDVTWTDNGTFNLSEGHTPQTENSEDLDREEAFTGGLQEFPSLDNGATTNGDDDDDLSLGLPALLIEPRRSVASEQTRPPRRDRPADKALELVNQMAGDFIAAAVTAAIQERMEAAVGSAAVGSAAVGSAAVGSAASAGDDPERSRLGEFAGLLELAEESDSEAEDFELLDQSELEQLEEELGLGEKKEEAQAQSDKSASTGFFTKLLRRH